MEPAPELKDLTLRVYDAFKRGNATFIEKVLSTRDEALVIGTDPKEWWIGAASFLPAVRAQLREMGGSLPIEAGELQAYQAGSVGWVADRPTFKLPDGSALPFRMTAVFEQQGGDWKVVQWHLSIGVPNEEVVGQELTV